MDRIFFHIDLDAFFANVEKLDDPQLADKPVVVGALPGRRGVVSTCSYEARKFGIHSAMPISEAYKRCPTAVFLPVRMKRYAEISHKVMRLFLEFTPDVRQISIDEAFLDMTGTEALWGDPPFAAAKIKARIRSAVGLGISIGVAPNRYVAKIASGLEKPDGLVIVRKGQESEFMRRLPLDRLWGSGEKTRKALESIGVKSIADLQAMSHNVLSAKFGDAAAGYFEAASRGEDPGFFGTERSTRSMSGERTFETDTSQREKIENVLRRISDELAARVFASSQSSGTLAIKLRFQDFTSITRQTTREDPFLDTDDIYETGISLLNRNWNGFDPLRLVGLGLQDLRDISSFQSSLFGREIGKSELARRAAAAIEERGKGKLVRARFLSEDKD